MGFMTELFSRPRPCQSDRPTLAMLAVLDLTGRQAGMEPWMRPADFPRRAPRVIQ